MIWAISGVSLIVLMSSEVFGQSAVPPRAFEVASIKPHDGPLHTVFGFSSSGTRVTLEGYSPILLVMEAYKLKNYQVSFPQRFRRPTCFTTSWRRPMATALRRGMSSGRCCKSCLQSDSISRSIMR